MQIRSRFAALAAVCVPAFAFGWSVSEAQTQTEPQYPTSQRVQIPEPCQLIAKWLTQALVAGPHWQMPRYDSGLGVLAFSVVSADRLTKAEIRRYVADVSKKDRSVHPGQLIFTLRSLVASTVSFDSGQSSVGDSCTIAAAFKFVNKSGDALPSTGAMEAELLQAIRDRYAEHGLDY